MGRTCSMYGRYEKCIQYFCGKPVGKRPLVRCRHRWKGNSRIDLRETGLRSVD
jgi:hypothetical protein